MATLLQQTQLEKSNKIMRPMKHCGSWQLTALLFLHHEWNKNQTSPYKDLVASVYKMEIQSGFFWYTSGTQLQKIY